MNYNFSFISGKIMDLLNRFYKYFVIVFVLVILVCGYTFVVKPKWDEINQTGIFDYNYETKSLEETRDYLTRLKASIAKYEQLNQSDIDRLSQIIPSDEKIQDLFVIFQDLADKNLLQVKSIDVTTGNLLSDETATAAAPAITETAENSVSQTQAQEVAQTGLTGKNIGTLDISLTLTGSGDYQEIKKMLISFEKELRIMDVVALDFSLAESTTTEKTVDYNLQIKTYYYEGKAQ